MNMTTNEMRILNGDVQIFSDFESDGEMWAGDGDREKVVRVDFDKSFRSAPRVHISLSMLDMQSGTNHRFLLESKNVTRQGFSIKFQTWADTKIARASASWIAFGEAENEDNWQV